MEHTMIKAKTPNTPIPTTRRALLAGAPAVAAAALAGGTAVNALSIVEAKATEFDPIFAVIAEHRAAWTRYDQTEELYSKLRGEEEKTTDLWKRCRGINLGEQEELRMEHFINDEGEADWRTVKTGRVVTVWTDSPPEIEMYAPEHLSDRQWRAWIRAKMADLDRAHDAQEAARARLPSRPAYHDWNKAGRALNRATKQMMRAKFTTPEGAAAALKHWGEFTTRYGFEKEWFVDAQRNTKFMANVAKALLRLEA
jgi:hypothetical protein